MTDNIKQVTPEEFCAMFAPAYGDSWDGAARSLERDPVERWIIDVLAEEAAAGRLREPVRVWLGDNEDPTPCVANGMHRVLACLRTGTPISYTDEPEPEAANGYLLVKFTFRKLEEEQHDVVFSVIRSFPVSDDWWATSDVISSVTENDGTVVVSAVYGVPEDAEPALFEDELREAVVPLLDDARLTVLNVHIAPADWDNED